MGENLVDWLRRASDLNRGGLRFVDRAERESWIPWREMWVRAQHVAGGLQAAGVEPGDRVALIHPTGPEFFDGFFGALAAGAVPVPLYPPVRLGRLTEYHVRTSAMLRGAGARLVLADRRVRRILGETMAGASVPLGCRTVSELPAGTHRRVESDPDDLALVQFSSGTTVGPKPVALSHRAIMAQTHVLNGFWPDDSEVRHSGASWLPLYHDMGLIGCIFPALERPSEITLIPPEAFVARPALWLRAISRYGATVSPAPNFAYGLCLKRIRDEELEGIDLSCWRVALNGAESISPEVLRAFCHRFARWGFRAEALTPVYGLSEASLAVTFSDLGRRFETRRFDRERLARDRVAVDDDRGRELVSVGRPLPGFSVEVRDRKGRTAPEGRVGRVWVAGPSLMDRYLGMPEATARALVDGWLDTGDLGFVRSGELYLVGRAKDVVILRGRNLAPEEIEQSLAGVMGFRSGCAVAASYLPEGADGEVLLLFVEHEQELDGAEIRTLSDRCRKAVIGSVGVQVDSVEVLAPGTLPRTSSGKLRRGETLRRFLDGELHPAPRVTALRMGVALARSGLAFARARKGRT